MMRPLEPHELLVRCDLAGEAKVLTVRPNRSGQGALARLEFVSIVKGRVETFRTELPGIAIVESGERWLPAEEQAPHARQVGLTIPVVRLTKRRSKEIILGSTSSISFEPGTLVFTWLSWDDAKAIYVPTWWNALSVLGRPGTDGG